MCLFLLHGQPFARYVWIFKIAKLGYENLLTKTSTSFTATLQLPMKTELIFTLYAMVIKIMFLLIQANQVQKLLCIINTACMFLAFIMFLLILPCTFDNDRVIHALQRQNAETINLQQSFQLKVD